MYSIVFLKPEYLEILQKTINDFFLLSEKISNGFFWTKTIFSGQKRFHHQ